MRDYDHEEFRPWYVADSPGYLELSLLARGLVADLLRKFDKRGQLRLRRLSDLAILLRLRWEGEIEPAVTELLSHGRLVWDEASGTLTDPEFVDRMRVGSAARMARKRAREAAWVDVTDVTRVTAGDVVTSPLLSSDLISSDLLSSERDPDPTSTPREAQASTVSQVLPKARPEWVTTQLEAVTTDTGEQFDGPIVWLTYQAKRESECKPISPADFRKFLGSWASNQKSDRIKARDRTATAARGRNADRQPHDEGWLKRMREREAAAGTGTDDIFGGDL